MLRYGKGTLLITVLTGLLALSLLTAGYGCEPRLFRTD